MRRFDQGSWLQSSSTSIRHIPLPNALNAAYMRIKFAYQFCFDKPLKTRYFHTLKRYLSFQFGNSFFKSASVSRLIIQRVPVSLSLAGWSLLFIYSIAVPIGALQACHLGHYFDKATQFMVLVSYMLPPLLLASLFILFFASDSYFALFPLRGMTSINFDTLSWFGKIKDYFWHLFLPLLMLVLSNVSSLVLLTRYAFKQEMTKADVMTAKAKGLAVGQILYRHIFRKFPTFFLSLVFGNTVLIEIMFSLPGLGTLGYDAILERDYPVILATVYIFNRIALITATLSDIVLSCIEPHIHFEAC